jgi:hypothetical protein
MTKKDPALNPTIALRLTPEDRKRLGRLLDFHPEATNSKVVLRSLYSYLEVIDALEATRQRYRECYQLLVEIYSYIDKNEEARTNIRTWRDHVKSKRLL